MRKVDDIPVTFYALATGERYLHVGARATLKVSGDAR
jgi:hypothetical protein